MKFIDPPRRVAEALPSFTGRAWVLPPVLNWLEKTNERVMLITGEPGTGKSMLAAWLAGMGGSTGPVNPELERFKRAVRAVHFCVAKGGNSPKAFAQNIADQFAGNVPGFGQALVETLRDSVTIRVAQNIGTATGAVTGVIIERLELGGLSDESSFDRVLRDPLKELYKTGFNEPILLLVDALDESIAYAGTGLDQLLARLDDFPVPVRVLVTTRPHPRVLYQFPDCPVLDLIKDAPPGCDDVREYVGRSLGHLPEPDRSEMIQRVTVGADGIFLYARLVIDDLLKAGGTARKSDQSLPMGLPGLYQEFLNREFAGPNRARWFGEASPVLGLIAVGRGRGLSRSQLTNVCGRPVEQTLETLCQYLDGEMPDGPFRPFHKSLADYLLEAAGNKAYHIDSSVPHLQIANYYLGLKNGSPAWARWGDYGMRHVPSHLADGIRHLPPEQRDAQTEQLIRLVSDRDFRAEQTRAVGDPGWHQRDFEKAVHCASVNVARNGPLRLVEAALGLVAARHEQLQPAGLFELARRGQLDEAERHLALFAPDRFWREIVLLTLAWCALPDHPAEAKVLRHRIVPGSGSATVNRLMSRVDAALANEDPPGPFCQGAPDLFFVTRILERLGGGMGVQGGIEPLIVSGLGSNQDDAPPAYLAEQDGPPLVAFAVADPDNNTRHLREYIALHAANPYVFYRNRSLAALVTAVQAHPDQQWVCEILEELCSKALAGGGVDFRSGVRLACTARRIAGGDDGAAAGFVESLNGLRAQASSANPERGQGDSWSHLLRGLAVQAELHATILDKRGEVPGLLDQAFKLPFGFAGFRSRAGLTLAEAIRVAEPQDRGSQERALALALQAAHNVQDFRFCAQETSRVNALTRCWWPKPPGALDVREVVRRFVRQPDDVEFSAVHVMGEDYGRRERSPYKLEIPPHVYHAATLAQLAAFYACPVAELVRLNRKQNWTQDQVLPPGTEVNVPDAKMPPILAARFAAEVLAADGLASTERTELIQLLVPAAASDATALDAVLTRLIIASDKLPVAAWRELQEKVEQLIPPEDDFSKVKPSAILRAEM